MILITGASGNVGREVVKQALAVGLEIRATFQDPAVAAKAPAGLEGVIMDYSKPETIRAALRGVEKILLVLTEPCLDGWSRVRPKSLL